MRQAREADRVGDQSACERGLAEVQRVLFQSLQRAKWQRPSDNTAGGQEVTRERRVLVMAFRLLNAEGGTARRRDQTTGSGYRSAIG